MNREVKAFYNWLARKYGWGKVTFQSLEEDVQGSFIHEFNEISRSYGFAPVLIEEVTEGK